MRTSVEVDLDETTDLEQARVVAVRAMDALPSVLPEPAPKALLTRVGAATVTLELRFWSGSLQLETLEARNAVISAVLQAFTEAGVRTGSDAVVIEPGPVLREAIARRDENPRTDSPS